MAITLTFPEGGALVTGGTGTVGEGIVRRLAEGGVPVIFTFKSREGKANEIVEDLRAKGCEVRAHAMDGSDPASIERALDSVVDAYGRVHTVACGSGTPVTFNKLVDFPPDYVSYFLNDDALSYYRIARAAVSRMRKSGGGSITVCTTLALRRYLAYDGISAFSKGAVDQMVHQIAAEEAEHKIRCNAVQIGCVASAKSEEEFQKLIPSGGSEDENANRERFGAVIQQLFDWARLGGFTSPWEAGGVFAFLASNEASFLTGQNLTLDGGMTL